MHTRPLNHQSGFSLLELIIAMGITITIMGLSSSLLAGSFHIRSREDRKSDAIADVQRALNIMTREISNAGMKLPGGLPFLSSNGVVAGDLASTFYATAEPETPGGTGVYFFWVGVAGTIFQDTVAIPDTAGLSAAPGGTPIQ